jgi:hypothetical protein
MEGAVSSAEAGRAEPIKKKAHNNAASVFLMGWFPPFSSFRIYLEDMEVREILYKGTDLC